MPTLRSVRFSGLASLSAVLLLIPVHATIHGEGLVRSAQSGPWSAASTWEGNQAPNAGVKVLIRPSHTVIYDVHSDQAIRSLHIGGALSFAPDKDTRLDVGLIKIQAGEDTREEGFDCDAHVAEVGENQPRPTLAVGTLQRPIDVKHLALIRLVYFDGMDKQSCPAILCCGGQMDFHGATMSTWVKLGATARKGQAMITLAERVIGWRVGDRVILTATKLTHDIGGGGGDYSTEERTIRSVEGAQVTLDRPLDREHLGVGDYRGEVANLSRNVVVESADPKSARGHTMYHRGSAGSISYAEFRHLGKEGVLGRYSLHYHLAGDTMRGSSVVGASIWDSGNRWLTIHRTNYLVVRDCVGYQSVGHGFFLEDGTEVYNVLDRNLAVQAFRGKPLPKQALPFDRNEGAGFWWANCFNTFTRNVSCENHRYGYRFEATQGSSFKVTLPVRQPDGEVRPVDIRTLPFVCFEDNEAHCDGLYGFNLGEGVARVGPDARHPLVVRNMKLWEVHYAFRPQSPTLLVENMQIHRAAYGVYHPNYDRHVYRNLTISETDTEPFNRGHDDDSVQYGSLTVDGLNFAGNRMSSMPLIQLSDNNPTGTAESHFRNLRVIDRNDKNRRALINLGGGPRPTPKTPTSVPVYIHDYYGPGKHAKVVSTRAGDVRADTETKYKEEPPLTGDESRVVEVSNVSFPQLLDPVDDLPPATVITAVRKLPDGRIGVFGTASDNGAVTRVIVNGQKATASAPNFAQWAVTLAADQLENGRIQAHAVDAAGNAEKRPHVVIVR